MRAFNIWQRDLTRTLTNGLETVMLPLHQSSITALSNHNLLNHKKALSLALYGGGEETRTLTPCGAGT